MSAPLKILILILASFLIMTLCNVFCVWFDIESPFTQNIHHQYQNHPLVLIPPYLSVFVSQYPWEQKAKTSSTSIFAYLTYLTKATSSSSYFITVEASAYPSSERGDHQLSFWVELSHGLSEHLAWPSEFLLQWWIWNRKSVLFGLNCRLHRKEGWNDVYLSC